MDSGVRDAGLAARGGGRWGRNSVPYMSWSPLFNSLPVIRDRLLGGGPARLYEMRWVDVPSLAVSSSEQRYEPLGSGRVRFSAGDFTADIRFDEAGFVLDYPGIATRVWG
jgi:uncharacterized protein